MEQFQHMRKSLAHSKFTSHAVGPSDLRPLNDLLASEKDVYSSMLRLSVSTKKSCDSLREWGANQVAGEDLNDVLSKVSFLFEQLGKAQAKFAEHLQTYRSHFKDLRAREENYLALRRARDALQAKIDSADKQLAKTGAEHKDRLTRETKLYDLKQEMIGLSNSLVNEEARLGDEKRRITRDALGLKLGALLELGERQTVISEMSRMLIAEIPQERSEPGKGRPAYNGYSATEETMQEAQKCLTSIVFNPTTEPSENIYTPQRDEQGAFAYRANRSSSQLNKSTEGPAPQLPNFNDFSSTTPQHDHSTLSTRHPQDAYQHQQNEEVQQRHEPPMARSPPPQFQRAETDASHLSAKGPVPQPPAAQTSEEQAHQPPGDYLSSRPLPPPQQPEPQQLYARPSPGADRNSFLEENGSGLAYLSNSISSGAPPTPAPAPATATAAPMPPVQEVVNPPSAPASPGVAPPPRNIVSPPPRPSSGGGGPPQNYNASGGRPRGGSRSHSHAEAAQYDYEEDRHWVRNQAATDSRQGPVSPPAEESRPPALTPVQLSDAQPSRTYARPDPPRKKKSTDEGAAASSSRDMEYPTLPKLPSQLANFSRSSIEVSQPPQQQQAIPSPEPTPSPSAFPQPPPGQQQPSKPAAPARKLSSPPTSPGLPGPGQSKPSDFYNARVSANEILQSSLPTAPPRVPPVVSVPGRGVGSSSDMNPPMSPSGAPRASGSRARVPDSKLGSKHGFDDPAYRGESERNTSSQPSQFPTVRPSKTDNTGPPSGYTYHPPGQYTVPASAFGSSANRRSAAGPPSNGPSPAMMIQQDYLRKQRESLDREREAQAAAEAQAQVAAQQQAEESEAQGLPLPGQSMDHSGEPDPVAPLKVNKRRSEDPRLPHTPNHSVSSLPPYQEPPPPSSPAPSSARYGGGGGNRYITRLD